MRFLFPVNVYLLADLEYFLYHASFMISFCISVFFLTFIDLFYLYKHMLLLIYDFLSYSILLMKTGF